MKLALYMLGATVALAVVTALVGLLVSTPVGFAVAVLAVGCVAGWAIYGMEH